MTEKRLTIQQGNGEGMEQETTESIADALTASMNELSEAETETVTDEQAVSQEEAAPEIVETQVEAVEEDSEESEEPETVFQAPEHWSSELKDQFGELTPEAQDILLQRDKEFQTGFQEKAQGIAAITEALEPWKDALAQRGVTAEQAIRTLFAAQHQLDANPVQGILQIAQSYGVLDQVKNQFVPETNDEDFVDPEIKALRQEISDLKGQVTQTTYGMQQQNTNAAQTQIDNFASAKDDSGGLKHPHFQQVKTKMAPLVNEGRTLEEAYNEVVWTVPEFRESQLKAVAADKQVQSDAEKARKVKQAKRAARSVKANGKANPDEGEDALTLGDTLREAYRQHSA